ncbi:hypothetical protein Tco_1400214 [Tanacetum coccineum]
MSQPVSITVQAPLPTSTTTVTTITTTTSLPPPPPQQQQSIADPILVRRIGKLEQHMADLLQDNLALGERLDKHGTRQHNLEKLDIPHKVSQAVDKIVTDAVDWAMQAPLRARFRDLPTVDMKEILQQGMFEDNSYKDNNVHNDLYEALQKSLELDYSNQRLSKQEEARKKRRKRRDAPRSPPGSPPSQPPPLAGASGAPASAQQSMAWTTSVTRYESTGIVGAQELSPSDDLMHDDSAPDEQVHVSNDQYSGDDHTPTAAASRKYWWKPLLEGERPATLEPAWTILPSNMSDVENNSASALDSSYEPPTKNSLLAKTGDMTTFLNWYCRQINKSKFTQADLEGQTYEVVKDFYPDIIYLQFQMEECHKMLTDQMKAARYPNFGLELLVPKQMWIEDVCTYDISANYSYSRREFVPFVRSSQSSRYGYDYLSEIVLRRGHLDHLSGLDKWMLSTVVNLWTHNLVIRQRVEDFQLGIESYETQLNLTKPGWDTTGYEFKHVYTIIESPRAVIFPVNNNERKTMRFNEIYKFSDGTLIRILETLDYRVKEFKIK